jgi:hypothetical protein
VNPPTAITPADMLEVKAWLSYALSENIFVGLPSMLN